MQDYETLKRLGDEALGERVQQKPVCEASLLKALDYFQQALALEPNNPEAHKNIGAAYALQRHYDPAKEHYHKALALDPQYWPAHHNLGLIYTAQKQYAEAIASFEKAIQCTSDTYISFNSFGNLYAEIEQFEKAHECFERAIELRPKGFSAGYHLAKTYMQQKQYPQAIHTLSEIFDDTPQSLLEDYYMVLAIAYEGNREIEKAIDIYRGKLMELRPDYAYYFYRLGNLYFNQEDTLNAIWAYEKGTELEPDNLDCWYRLPGLYFRTRNHHKAIQLLERHYDESFSSVHSSMFAWALLETKQYEKALPYAQKGLKSEPEDPMHHALLGLILAEAKQWDEALKNFSNAFDRAENESISKIDIMLHHMADVLEEHGEVALTTLYREKAKAIKLKEASVKALD